MKTDSQVSPECQEKIVRQIEYYFSDFNLSRDKFMNEQMTKDDGWIPLSVLLTFKRLQALTQDAKVIVDSIRAANSDFVEISDDESKIRRSTNMPLPDKESYRDQVIQRTLHIKGFPLDSKFDTLYEYCNSLAPLDSLQMRKTRNDGIFKGCVLAVFKNKEDAVKILQEKLLYGEKELLKEREEEHINRRKEFYKSRKQRSKPEEKNSDDKVKDPTSQSIPTKDGQENVVPMDDNIKPEEDLEENSSKRAIEDGDSAVASETMTKKVKTDPSDEQI